MKTYYLDNEGREHIVSFAIEDWWVLDMHSFVAQVPAFYNIQALEDTELLQLNRQQHELQYNLIPKFDRFSRIMLENSFIAQQKRIIQSLSQDAEERYRLFREISANRAAHFPKTNSLLFRRYS